MIHGLHLVRHEAEGHDRGRVAVHDGHDIRPRLVDLAMDEPLQEAAAALGVHRLGVEVEFHDVVGFHQRGGLGARHQEAIRGAGMAHGEVAEGVEHALISQNAAGAGQLFQHVAGDGASGGQGLVGGAAAIDGAEGGRTQEAGGSAAGAFEESHVSSMAVTGDLCASAFSLSANPASGSSILRNFGAPRAVRSSLVTQKSPTLPPTPLRGPMRRRAC